MLARILLYKHFILAYARHNHGQSAALVSLVSLVALVALVPFMKCMVMGNLLHWFLHVLQVYRNPMTIDTSYDYTEILVVFYKEHEKKKNIRQIPEL